MCSELANVFASLLSDLWSGQYRSLSPHEFKSKLERFAPTFAGYQQHDAQELLSFLLDGLHEDLNRVTTKPATETLAANGRPDGIVAAEAWQNYRARNDSFIVDNFQGLLRSEVRCPKCERISVTFDPFMYLSLPLPMKTSRLVELIFVPDDGTKKPIKMKVQVQKSDRVLALKQQISQITGVPPHLLILCDVPHSYFMKLFYDSDSMDSVQDNDDVYAYVSDEARHTHTRLHASTLLPSYSQRIVWCIGTSSPTRASRHRSLNPNRSNNRAVV